MRLSVGIFQDVVGINKKKNFDGAVADGGDDKATLSGKAPPDLVGVNKEPARPAHSKSGDAASREFAGPPVGITSSDDAEEEMKPLIDRVNDKRPAGGKAFETLKGCTNTTGANKNNETATSRSNELLKKKTNEKKKKIAVSEV